MVVEIIMTMVIVSNGGVTMSFTMNTVIVIMIALPLAELMGVIIKFMSQICRL